MENKTALTQLWEFMEQNQYFIGNDLELIICEPEITSFNASVRDKLDELQIDYRTDF